MERNWTPQQVAIFEWFGKPTAKRNALVRARAGTGKTSTIVEALKYAPETLGGRVLLAAFNKRIADELVTKAPRRVDVKTLHALGLATLRQTFGKVGINDRRGRELAEEISGRMAPKEAVGLVAKLASIGKLTLTTTVQGLVKLAGDFDVEPSGRITELPPVDDEYRKEGLGPWTVLRIAELAHKAMTLAAENVSEIDFDDMLWIPAARSIRPNPYDLVVIDEAQDMNAAQLALARSAARASGRICVVGDNRQALYSFMGADANAVDRMKLELDAVEMPLSATFRCPSRVVAMAQVYVPDYRSAPGAAPGVISSLGDVENMPGRVAPGDFVLSRSNAGAAEACLSLLRAGVRATVIGRDVGASLKRLVEGFGVTTLQDLLRAVSKWAELESGKAKASGREEKIERIRDQQETISALCSGLKDVPALLARIDELFADKAAAGRVACSTVHKAKGLEAEQIFVLVPTFRACLDEEEDNLKYVAITRTKNSLVFVGKPPGDKRHPFEDAMRRAGVAA